MGLALLHFVSLLALIMSVSSGETSKGQPAYNGLMYANFKTHSKSYLNITSVATELVQDKTDCAFACVATESCFSFNLARNKTSIKLCELLPSDKYINSDKFVTSQFYDHFSIPSPCSSGPCRNKGTCVPVYQTNSFTCLCAKGYTGGNCEIADLLENHEKYCNGVNGRPTRIEMPKNGENTLSFQNYHKQMKVPYVIYADFEALVRKMQRCERETLKDRQKRKDLGEELEDLEQKSYTEKTEQHEACGFSYTVVRSDGINKPPVTYREPFMKKDYKDSVKDHCHITGKFRGAAHNACNLKLRIKPKTDQIPVVFHNLKGYDAHHLMQAMTKLKLPTKEEKKCGANNMDVKCVANNMEKYITFSFGGLKFIDSLSFLLTSLEKCVESTPKQALKITKKLFFEKSGLLLDDGTYPYEYIEQWEMFKENDLSQSFFEKLLQPEEKENIISRLGIFTNEKLKTIFIEQYEKAKTIFLENFELLTKKGIYPYEYIDSWDRFKETILPKKENFYSKLNDEHITDKEYKHAQNVWKTFGCQTLSDYHDLYVQTDVTLLADVFENSRKICLEKYVLDPANYYTSPGLSWDALLKKTGVQLELLTDYDMHLFVERGIRGGISMVSKRYAKANNPYVEGYDEKNPKKYLMYLDANNLYGWAMSKPLPKSGFRWKRVMPTEKK
ncbi:hypothetical protein ACROYT_G016776 [Oculina patagonica]